MSADLRIAVIGCGNMGAALAIGLAGLKDRNLRLTGFDPDAEKLKGLAAKIGLNTAASPLAAARRELLEETGHVSEDWTEIWWVSPNPAIQSNRCFTFRARGCRRVGDPSSDGTEDLRVEAHAEAEVPALVRDGGDGVTWSGKGRAMPVSCGSKVSLDFDSSTSQFREAPCTSCKRMSVRPS